jgi:hypothetical protein
MHFCQVISFYPKSFFNEISACDRSPRGRNNTWLSLRCLDLLLVKQPAAQSCATGQQACVWIKDKCVATYGAHALLDLALFLRNAEICHAFSVVADLFGLRPHSALRTVSSHDVAALFTMTRFALGVSLDHDRRSWAWIVLVLVQPSGADAAASTLSYTITNKWCAAFLANVWLLHSFVLSCRLKQSVSVDGLNVNSQRKCLICPD